MEFLPEKIDNERSVCLGICWNLKSDSPSKVLEDIAKSQSLDVTSENFATCMDDNDKLKKMRGAFVFPRIRSSAGDDEECIYFAGHALGLQPKQSKRSVSEVLENWKQNAVESHFVEPLPAATCDNYVAEQMAKMVGAKESEIAAMNGHHVNLHLMMVSFYQPNPKRHKILGDRRYQNLCVAESHIKQHGRDVKDSLLTIPYKEGKYVLNMDDVIGLINNEGESIATILLPGILDLSGQLLDIKRIVEVGHQKGCMVGFDLDDAVGNVELELHEWGVDFACWGSSKYLNSGQGSMGCVFLHEKHELNNFNKFLGWWGHKYSSRFEMTNRMEPSLGINGYKISNQSPVQVALLKSSLDIFDLTTMKEIREKSFLLTGYLEYLLKQRFPKPKIAKTSKIGVDIITPCTFAMRGTHISFRITRDMLKVYEELKKQGIVCRTFLPDVISVCPSPLFCSYRDVYRFASVMGKAVEKFK